VCPGDFDCVAFSDELEGCFIAVFDLPGGKSGVDPEETGRKERLVVLSSDVKNIRHNSPV
jgi:hypothetical protein